MTLSKGSAFTLTGIIAYEDFGLKVGTTMLSMLLTSAAVGTLIFDRILYSTRQSGFSFKGTLGFLAQFSGYNRGIYQVATIVAAAAFVTSAIAYALKWLKKKKEGKKSEEAQMSAINY